MNLYIFPEGANYTNGYSIGVDFAYKRLQPKEDDVIVWYTNFDENKMWYVKEKDIILHKNAFLSVRSVSNILHGKDRTELRYKDLSFLKDYKFDHIHCDESIFYRALRQIFPDQKMDLRLHNCYARIYDRLRMLQIKMDWKYETKLKNMYKLEREIFQDPNVFKIFISDEDRDYYRNIFGKYSDSETWAYIPDMEMASKNRKPIKYDHRLIWFGGVESHKKAAIDWFIADVLPEVKKSIPDVEFHLWGRWTDQFNDPENGIFGHGFYEGEGNPSDCSLYINPDIIGGGIKLKLQSLIESGVPFISSYFGYEGYSSELIDDKYIIVEEEGKWADRIVNIIK